MHGAEGGMRLSHYCLWKHHIVHEWWEMLQLGWRIDRITAGYGCLVMMEHEAGIEWVSGLRLGSGCGFGPGY